MAIDPKIYAALGITTVAQKLDLLNSYPKKFTDAQIQADLEESLRLRDIAQKKAQEISAQLGIPVANPQKPFAQTWDPYKKEIKLSAKLAGAAGTNLQKQDAPDFDYAGRTIETHIQNVASNSDFNPENIMESFDSIFQAASALAPQAPGKRQEYMRAIESIRQEFINGIEYSMPQSKKKIILDLVKKNNSSMDLKAQLASSKKSQVLRDSVETIRADLSKHLAKEYQSGKDLQQILKRYEVFNKLFIGRLAIALEQAKGTNLSKADASDQDKYKAYVKQIQDKQIEIVSNTKRPILVNVYKQEIADPQADTSSYIVVTHTPNSDVSSANRSLAQLMFSNDWTVTVERVDLKKNVDGTYTETKKLLKTYIRSSSIARITYGYASEHRKDKKLAEQQTKDEFKQVYTAFRKLVVQYAREDLIRKINTLAQEQPGHEISIDELIANNTLNIKEAYLTLLSPIVSKETGIAFTSRLGKAVTTKTIYENEAAQLEMTKKCLLRIANDPELKFDDKDARAILSRTADARRKMPIKDFTNSRIKSITLKHRSYFSNYMVNKLGQMRMEKSDFRNKNRAYFLEGNRRRRACITDYIQTSPELAKNIDFKNALLDIFDPDINQAQNLRAQLEKIKKEQTTQLYNAPKIFRIIELYLAIEQYYDKANFVDNLKNDLNRAYNYIRSILQLKPSDTRVSGRIVSSYVTANIDLELATILGYKPHFTCKSGVDRTGLLASFVEALSAGKDILKIDIALLEKNIVCSLQHGANRLVKCANLPGVAGLQLSPNVITTMPVLSAFLAEKCMDKVGKMGKIIFQHNKTIFKLATSSAQKAHDTIYKPIAPTVKFSQTPGPSRQVTTKINPPPMRRI